MSRFGDALPHNTHNMFDWLV